MKIGSLCTGYGGLDLAVEKYFGAKTIWYSEIDKQASKVLKNHHPYTPNLGDLKAINWDEVEPVDILTAGYPCQPFSNAGKREGNNDPRHLFPYILDAIRTIRPRICVFENVAGHLTLGFTEVLGSLAQCGYDVKWRIVQAAEAGAPHQRKRLFIIAHSNSDARQESRRTDREISGTPSEIIHWADRQEPWGSYSYAIRKWEQLTRPAPEPLADDKLNPEFVEWIMGLPKGWVTSQGLSRTAELKILGNGVVPQQAELAIHLIESM